MHVNFHQSMTTFLTAKTKTLRKTNPQRLQNYLLQCEFCKLYNLTNWLFRIVHLADWPISHEALVKRAFWILDHNMHMSQCPHMKMRPFPVGARQCGTRREQHRALPLLWLQHGSLSVLSPRLTADAPNIPDTGPLSLLYFPCITFSTGYCSAASQFSKFETSVPSKSSLSSLI